MTKCSSYACRIFAISVCFFSSSFVYPSFSLDTTGCASPEQALHQLGRSVFGEIDTYETVVKSKTVRSDLRQVPVWSILYEPGILRVYGEMGGGVSAHDKSAGPTINRGPLGLASCEPLLVLVAVVVADPVLRVFLTGLVASLGDEVEVLVGGVHHVDAARVA